MSELRGDGAWRATVTLPQSVMTADLRDGELLCELHGVDFGLRNDGRRVPTLQVIQRKRGVVDFEHDTSKLALIEVAIPYSLFDDYDKRRFVGVIEDIRLYPEGVDPLTQDDADTDAGEGGPEVCGYGPDHKPHRFAPYLPPERRETQALRGRAVVVELTLENSYYYGSSDEDDD